MAVPVMPAELLVELEEILQRDRGQRLRFFLDLDAVAGVLGLDGLMQAVGPLPANHEAAREFVDDDDAHLARFGMAHHRVLLVLL